MSIDLDRRIPNKNCILTCFDTERAKQYIGKQGYFTNCFSLFVNINSLVKGTLTKICDYSVNEKYATNVGEKFYSFFLPEECLKLEEEKLKPYNSLAQLPFTIGDVILLKGKNEISTAEICACTSISIVNDNSISYISFGTTTYTPKELLEDYEWKSVYLKNAKFKPFGVKE